MRYKKILVTGGAGFIGSFLVDELIKKNYRVRIFDNLEKQVHHGKKPSYLNKKAEFIKGDVRDCKSFEKALKNTDVVFHLASRVGVAQSNYEIKDYVDANIGAIANLMDIVVNKHLPVKKIIMTASMTSYGEGNYFCKRHKIVKPPLRPDSQMQKHDWEPHCPICKKHVTPIATAENAVINNNSIYSFTKNAQETMLMLMGKMYHIPVVSLRCFNVYGPRQSLSNPYTGVSAIFISRLKNNRPPVIYEDGLQSRDFVSVHDVVTALISSMESDKANYEIFNIGNGKPTSIKEVAKTLAKLLGKRQEPVVNFQFRTNDIRHCFADISKAKKVLKWKARVSLEEGLAQLIKWSEKEEANDLFQDATKELKAKKLIHEKN
ncbi:MAG TPA: SDR family NAD(P)-dependent oxidoreductase [Candidatus Saccharimonadales bacterium]|nr:SDR family NAD(P)-dependent oxidoreductase [Candidatus Saccharimonadales bacterium]